MKLVLFALWCCLAAVAACVMMLILPPAGVPLWVSEALCWISIVCDVVGLIVCGREWMHGEDDHWIEVDSDKIAGA